MEPSGVGVLWAESRGTSQGGWDIGSEPSPDGVGYTPKTHGERRSYLKSTGVLQEEERCRLVRTMSVPPKDLNLGAREDDVTYVY